MVALDAAETAVFDVDADRWLIEDLAARVLIDSVPQPAGTRVGRLTLADAEARFGVHPYLGVARHGFPNYFTVTDRNAGAYVVECLKALWQRQCTRVEVKPHVHAQFSRNVDSGLNRLNPPPALADFEYTRAEDREGDDDYRGPAMLTGLDGIDVGVDVHLLAVFQPVDSTVRWSGRVLPSPALAGLHRNLNQPVTIRIGNNEAVAAVLVDHDPWGGSHIVGEGVSPYPLPLMAELAAFETR